MGVITHKDIFSSKWVTAEIKDASKRLWYVPIKNVIGDFFLAEINSQVYCFKIDSEICQYRESLTKSFHLIQYDISHYRPIKSEIKELELALAKNNLPKVDGYLSKIFKNLAQREKKGQDFTPHSLLKLIEKLTTQKTDFISSLAKEERRVQEEQIETIITYLENLSIDEITTPLKSISNFIEDDLKATDPKILGTITTTLTNLDFENKKVTNTPISPKMAWLKWLLVMTIGLVIVFFVYYAWDHGYFDSFTNAAGGFEGVNIFGGFSPPASSGYSDKELQGKYTPEQLKAAIDRGEIDYNKLSPLMKQTVDNVKLPAVSTTP